MKKLLLSLITVLCCTVAINATEPQSIWAKLLLAMNIVKSEETSACNPQVKPCVCQEIPDCCKPCPFSKPFNYENDNYND